MVEHKAYVECDEADAQEGSLAFWERKVQEYKEMLIPPYYPYREALEMVEQLKGGQHE